MVKEEEYRTQRGIMSFVNMEKGGTASHINEEHKKALLKMPMHGKFLRQQAELPQFNETGSTNWSHTAHLRYETESFICAAQEQALATGHMRAKIWGNGETGKYRLCKEANETVEHIVSGCKMLANKIYLHRHNYVCTYLHWEVLKYLGAAVPDKWVLHKPEPSTIVGQVTVTYDSPLLTDKNVKHNKPDICVWNKKTQSAQIIDVAIPMDRNMTKKEA